MVRRALEIGLVALVAVSLQGRASSGCCDVTARTCSEQSMGCAQTAPDEAPSRGHCGDPVSAVSGACCGAKRSEPVTSVPSVPQVGTLDASACLAVHLAVPPLSKASFPAAIAPPAPTRHTTVLRL